MRIARDQRVGAWWLLVPKTSTTSEGRLDLAAIETYADCGAGEIEVHLRCGGSTRVPGTVREMDKVLNLRVEAAS